MIKKLAEISLATLLTVVSAHAVGHHSRVTFFDMTRTVELAGVITRVQWRHPHVRYWIQADPDFGGALWELETTPPGLLERQGITRDILSAGTHVRVAGPPSKVAEHAMEVSHVLLPDGREVLLHTGRKPLWTDNVVARELQAFDPQAVRAAEAAAKGIFRVWTRPGMAGDDRPPYWLDAYPLSDSAQAQAATWDPLTGIETGCDPKPMPYLMSSFWPFAFEDGGDHIRLQAEENDQLRIIYLTATEPAGEGSPLGHSIGHWEGNTLVVATTQIANPQFDNRGIPLSRNVELLERFALSPDEQRLDYALTITDPATFTEPVTLTTYWIWQPGESVRPYDCIETPDSWTSREPRLLKSDSPAAER